MSRLATTALLTLVVPATACVEDVDQVPPADLAERDEPDTLSVTEISTTFVDSEFFEGDLEVEVHLGDAASGEWLGCAGQHQGLDGVDEPFYDYIVLAELVDRDNDLVLFEELVGRTLEVRVYDDDRGRCPMPPAQNDDLLGVSHVFKADELRGSLVLPIGAGEVVLGTDRTRDD